MRTVLKHSSFLSRPLVNLVSLKARLSSIITDPKLIEEVRKFPYLHGYKQCPQEYIDKVRNAPPAQAVLHPFPAAGHGIALDYSLAVPAETGAKHSAFWLKGKATLDTGAFNGILFAEDDPTITKANVMWSIEPNYILSKTLAFVELLGHVFQDVPVARIRNIKHNPDIPFVLVGYDLYKHFVFSMVGDEITDAEVAAMNHPHPFLPHLAKNTVAFHNGAAGQLWVNGYLHYYPAANGHSNQH